MNGRQAAKAAAARIDELEHVNRLSAADIKSYNTVILHMINHGSPCDYCHDADECRQAGKNMDTGCDDWMLMPVQAAGNTAQWQDDVQHDRQTGLFAAGGMD